MSTPQVEFITPSTSYEDVLVYQEQCVAEIIAGKGGEKLLFVEHAPIYTLGSSADPADILRTDIPSIQTGRGGQVTYHGPGQRVIYPILDLRKRGKDLRSHIDNLQYWVIEVLRELGIRAHLSDEVGVWVSGKTGQLVGSEAKIAAVGVRVRKWVAFHGLALNVAPDMSHYAGIVPCGITDRPVTSLKEMGIDASMADVDALFQKTFSKIFGV